MFLNIHLILAIMTLENYVNSNQNKDDKKENTSDNYQFPFTLEDVAKVRELVKKYAQEEEKVKQKESLEANKQELKEWIADSFRQSEGKEISDDCLEKAVNEYIINRKYQIEGLEQVPQIQEEENQTSLKSIAKTSAEMFASPFFMPTYWRRYSENCYNSYGNWFPVLAGGTMQFEALVFLSRARPLFMAYLVTNAISFIYEMVRPKRKEDKR